MDEGPAAFKYGGGETSKADGSAGINQDINILICWVLYLKDLTGIPCEANVGVLSTGSGSQDLAPSIDFLL